ncbi:MAG: putative serine/threonine phosphatase, partial [Myxococcales bacterium]|nr:putative serine/threonine phosphatase [Myxococcales bacterium]
MMLNSLSSWRSLRALTWAALLVSFAACEHTRETYVVVSGPRDWSAHPAVLDLSSVPGDLYAISDVHGGYDRMVALLVQHHLIAAAPATPADVVWSGGNATLIVVGDMIDKGPKSLEVVDFFVALQTSAQASGGKVIVTLGNHEAEFLYDPANDKAEKSDGVRTEMQQLGVDPIAVASGADPRGQWLRDLPFAGRVGQWLFAHAGNTAGRSITDLETALRNAVDLHPDFDSPEIVGGDSVLESKSWYDARSANARALGVG